MSVSGRHWDIALAHMGIGWASRARVPAPHRTGTLRLRSGQAVSQSARRMEPLRGSLIAAFAHVAKSARHGAPGTRRKTAWSFLH